MGDLGQRLKREREARGVSLDAIAKHTRIGVRSLKAIEEEAFDQLPGGIFNKSFIRQYAQYLGLDEEQAIHDYLRTMGALKETPSAQLQPVAKSSISANAPGVFRLALGAAAVVLVAMGAWLLVPRAAQEVDLGNVPAGTSAVIGSPRVSPDPGPAGFPPPSQPATSPETPRAGDDPSRDRGHVIAANSLPRREAPTTVSAADLLSDVADHEPLAGELPEELLLQINARSTVWISITADGEKQWQGTMKPNQRREVQAAQTIRLTVGNAGGVELTLNGNALGALGGEGEVKTVTLAARALQETIP
ncbi:MAG: DUF4115 domain-containing protein [Acidobacteria bacterium]|nr:DUF4115 domain-containing protein [Acidobacteriota bacterium]